MNPAWEYPDTGSVSANSALFVGFAVGKHIGILSFNRLVVCSGIAIRPPEPGWRLLAGDGLDVPVDRGNTAWRETGSRPSAHRTLHPGPLGFVQNPLP